MKIVDGPDLFNELKAAIATSKGELTVFRAGRRLGIVVTVLFGASPPAFGLCFQNTGYDLPSAVDGAVNWLTCLHNEQNDRLNQHSDAINDHGRAIGSLQDLVSANSSTISDLESENQTLRYELDSAKSEISDLESKIGDLETRLEALE